MKMHLYIYIYIYISYILLCTPILRKSEGARIPVALGLPSGPARLACWACLGLSTAFQGLSTAFPGPQYCLPWPPGRQLDTNWKQIGRQVDAKWAPSWTAKTAASADVRLKNATTAAKLNRTPCQQCLCRCIATGSRLYTYIYVYVYIYIYIYIHKTYLNRWDSAYRTLFTIQ